MTDFLRALAIGFAIAAPVGPIGVLCIRRTLADGQRIGLASGLGAATADGVYGLIAGLGLTAISGLMLEYKMWLRLIGGGFLVYLGVQSWRTRLGQDAAESKTGLGLVGAYASTFLLTLSNPVTILAFLTIFAGLGLAEAGNRGSAVVLVAGVFTGSALWWGLLSGGVGLLRERFTDRHMVWVNRVAGAIIIGFGLQILGSLL